MILFKTLDQYLPTKKVPKESINGLNRYKSFKTFNENIQCRLSLMLLTVLDVKVTVWGGTL